MCFLIFIYQYKNKDNKHKIFKQKTMLVNSD